jgi:hypothetical protein
LIIFSTKTNFFFINLYNFLIITYNSYLDNT